MVLGCDLIIAAAYWAGTGDHGFGGMALGGRLSVPMIARVNGPALGGGFEMVLGCDLIIAAETASFSPGSAACPSTAWCSCPA